MFLLHTCCQPLALHSVAFATESVDTPTGHVHQTPHLVCRVRVCCSVVQALRDMVASCLQKDPSKRPSAAELLQHRFFKAAKGPSYLSEALLAALLQPTHPPGSAPDTTAHFAASIPARLPSGAPGPGSFSASRKVHSEPLMARLRSVLGFAPPFGAGAGAPAGLGSLLGPRASRMGVAAVPKSDASGLEGGSTAAGGLSAVAGGSAAGSLSRSGSRGVKVSLPPSEAARCSFYSK